MTDPGWVHEGEDGPEPAGWRVLDPDGNVIASGPVIQLEAVAEMGDGTEEEETDGSD